MYILAQFRDREEDEDGTTTPYTPLYVVEHFFNLIFRSNCEDMGGLNVNQIDDLALVSIVGWKDLRNIFKHLNKVLTKYPTQRLPRVTDLYTWIDLFNGTSLKRDRWPLHLGYLCLGERAAKWIWDRWPNPALLRYKLNQGEAKARVRSGIKMGYPMSPRVIERYEIWQPPPYHEAHPSFAFALLQERLLESLAEQHS